MSRDKKTSLLNESVVRRFMKLAEIGPTLSSNFVREAFEDEEEDFGEEAVEEPAPEMDGPMDEPALDEPLGDEPALDMGAPDEMSPDEELEEAQIELEEDDTFVNEVVRRVARRLLKK